MKPTVKITISSIQIEDVNNELLNTIVEKISKTDLSNDGDGYFVGEIDFEQETSNEDLMLHVSGYITQSGYTEPETNAFVMTSVNIDVEVNANFNGDDVDFDVNQYISFDEAVKNEAEKLIN